MDFRITFKLFCSGGNQKTCILCYTEIRSLRIDTGENYWQSEFRRRRKKKDTRLSVGKGCCKMMLRSTVRTTFMPSVVVPKRFRTAPSLPFSLRP